MPNHVQNRLTLTGPTAKLAAAMHAIAGRAGKDAPPAAIDFNRIITMPKALEINPHFGIIAAVKKFCQVPPDQFMILTPIGDEDRREITYDFEGKEKELFEQGIENYRKTGYIYWYEWAIEKWGTKWNAYSSPDPRDHTEVNSMAACGRPEDGMATVFFHFETAWSMPLPVIEALADKYQDLDITIEWADEDVGANSGRLRICAAKGIYDLTQFENSSFEAYQMAIELMPNLKDELILSDDGKSYRWADVN